MERAEHHFGPFWEKDLGQHPAAPSSPSPFVFFFTAEYENTLIGQAKSQQSDCSHKVSPLNISDAFLRSASVSVIENKSLLPNISTSS